MARDLIHYPVRRALEKDGWVITSDPFGLRLDGVKLEVDLGAEKVIEIQKNKDKIYVEIKTFRKKSIVYCFYEAFGQYVCYRDALNNKDINHPIFLAIPSSAYNKIRKIPFLVNRIKQHKIKIIVINILSEKIVKWIK